MFTLIVSLLIVVGTDSKIETIQINGFKSETHCRREAAGFRVRSVRLDDVRIIFDHCVRVN